MLFVDTGWYFPQIRVNKDNYKRLFFWIILGKKFFKDLITATYKNI